MSLGQTYYILMLDFEKMTWRNLEAYVGHGQSNTEP